MKNRIHIAPNYFFQPTHPITVTVIGVGGTGSLMLPRLARIDFALQQLGHPGLHIKAFDDDRVEEFNIGRQLFSKQDKGEFKSTACVSKINRAFDLQWKGIPKKTYSHNNEILSNIIITCVDNAGFRVELAERLKLESKRGDINTVYYWLDLGNGKSTAQFILGTVCREAKNDINDFETVSSLATITELFPNLMNYDTEEIQGQGCSYRDKLNEQSLFINDVLTAHASDCLFSLLKDKQIFNHGAFINLGTGRVNPVHI